VNVKPGGTYSNHWSFTINTTGMNHLRKSLGLHWLSSRLRKVVVSGGTAPPFLNLGTVWRSVIAWRHRFRSTGPWVSHRAGLHASGNLISIPRLYSQPRDPPPPYAAKNPWGIRCHNAWVASKHELHAITFAWSPHPDALVAFGLLCLCLAPLNTACCYSRRRHLLTLCVPDRCIFQI
jgi:hypothetical protein